MQFIILNVMTQSSLLDIDSKGEPRHSLDNTAEYGSFQ